MKTLSTLKPGDIIICDYGDAKGSEIRKPRPAVVACYVPGQRTVVTLPISHNNSFKGIRFPLTSEDSCEELHLSGSVIIDQIRAIDQSKISRKIGRLKEAKFKELKELAKLTLF